MDQSLFSAPFISTFIFWLMGITGNWRRTLVITLLSYSAVILSFQHFRMIANMVKDTFGSSMNGDQRLAFGFGACLVIALIGLLILYNVLWKPTPILHDHQGGGVRFLLSLATALIGWVLGVLIAACYLEFADNIIVLAPGNETSFLWNAFRVSINVAINLVKPWLVQDPPSFLILLGKL